MSLLRKRFHPCGGFFIGGALKWLVPVNVIMLFVGLAMLTHDVYVLWDRWMRERRENILDYYIRLGLWLGYILHVLIAWPMDFFLYRASKARNTARLRIWTVVNFFNSVWAVVDYWVHTFYFGLHIPSLALYNAYCVYKFYMCIVVYYYIREIEDDEEMQAAARVLTEAELLEFENGTNFGGGLDLETRGLVEKVQYLKYKRDEFEVSQERLKIDEENPLGSGSYGVVYRGQYLENDEGELNVAVKTIEPGIMNALCFKALLSELKVMTYLGRHENVVNLIGAVTSEIKIRKLLMVVELCPLGCVLEYLRGSRGLFVNVVNNGAIALNQELKRTIMEEDNLSTFDLIKWSQEIANGMKYLEIMKVVHGDLAARNLLLTDTKQIKIADFGLARQLYQYSVYVKRQNVPLPWRWLALESITDMNFSTKSDVWSFGIVLHELFTLGQAPYNFQQFSLEFIEKLREGMRLEQPAFCPDIVYKVMKVCWNERPEDRPSFEHLQQNFQLLVQQGYDMQTSIECDKPNTYT